MNDFYFKYKELFFFKFQHQHQNIFDKMHDFVKMGWEFSFSMVEHVPRPIVTSVTKTSNKISFYFILYPKWNAGNFQVLIKNVFLVLLLKTHMKQKCFIRNNNKKIFLILVNWNGFFMMIHSHYFIHHINFNSGVHFKAFLFIYFHNFIHHNTRRLLCQFA